MDYLHGWNSSDCKDTDESDDDLSIPESVNEKTDKLEIEDILQDASKLFTGEFEDNNQQKGLQVRPSLNSLPIVNSFISTGNELLGELRGDREESPFILSNPKSNETHDHYPKISTLVENEERGGKRNFAGK